MYLLRVGFPTLGPQARTLVVVQLLLLSRHVPFLLQDCSTWGRDSSSTYFGKCLHMALFHLPISYLGKEPRT